MSTLRFDCARVKFIALLIGLVQGYNKYLLKFTKLINKLVNKGNINSYFINFKLTKLSFKYF